MRGERRQNEVLAQFMRNHMSTRTNAIYSSMSTNAWERAACKVSCITSDEWEWGVKKERKGKN